MPKPEAMEIIAEEVAEKPEKAILTAEWREAFPAPAPGDHSIETEAMG